MLDDFALRVDLVDRGDEDRMADRSSVGPTVNASGSGCRTRGELLICGEAGHDPDPKWKSSRKRMARDDDDDKIGLVGHDDALRSAVTVSISKSRSRPTPPHPGSMPSMLICSLAALTFLAALLCFLVLPESALQRDAEMHDLSRTSTVLSSTHFRHGVGK